MKKDKTDPSHKDLIDSLDNMSKVSEEMKNKFELLRIKKKYLKQIEEKSKNRTKAEVYHGLGRRAGLHDKDVESMKNNYRVEDQKIRNDVAEESKAVYKKDEKNLTREFNKQASGKPAKNPDLGLERE